MALAVLSLAYLLPILRRKMRIRDLPYLKIWAIALTWSVITIGLPSAISGVDSDLIRYMGIERFLFFVLITIPFDIRDKKEDHELGIRTLATSLSRRQLNKIGIILLLLHSILIWIFPFELKYTLAMQLAVLVAFIYLIKSKDTNPLWYFSFLVDGLIAGRLFIFWLIV